MDGVLATRLWLCPASEVKFVVGASRHHSASLSAPLCPSGSLPRRFFDAGNSRGVRTSSSSRAEVRANCYSQGSPYSLSRVHLQLREHCEEKEDAA